MLRRLMFTALRLPGVNGLVRSMRRPIKRLAGGRCRKIPVRGEVSLQLGADTAVSLYSDGRDSIASSFFWDGMGGFEPETLVTVKALAPRIETFVDIGANTGIYSLIVGAVNPQARVYAFEPVADIFHALYRNVQRNGLSNAVLFRQAVTGSVGAIEILVPESLSFPTESSAVEGFRPNVHRELAPCTSLERFAVDYGLQRTTLIKIDVEGFEYEVLKDCHTLLSKIRPLFICEVLYKTVDPRLEAQLEGNDYIFFHIRPSGLHRQDHLLGDSRYEFFNYLFVPEESIALVQGLDIHLVEET